MTEVDVVLCRGCCCRPLWLGALTGAEDTAALCAWVSETAAGGGQPAPPARLAALRIPAAGPQRRAVGRGAGTPTD